LRSGAAAGDSSVPSSPKDLLPLVAARALYICMHTEDAFDFLVEYLTKLPELKPGQRPTHNDRPYGSDFYIPHVVHAYYSREARSRSFDINELSEEQLRPLYDAAWELCRIGVLRPGHVAPKGQAMNLAFAGDGYGITTFGRSWLKDTARPLTDPSRLTDVLLSLGAHFGDGYKQRAAESVRCYRTGNHLATCVLAGAAAESILLAVAIAKAGGDESKVMSQYKSAGGRGRVLASVVANAPTGVASQFQHACQVMQYWRDEAAHGTATTISEVEAHTSITQLLRLAQFTSDHWARLAA
jgi:hypothetical protein